MNKWKQDAAMRELMDDMTAAPDDVQLPVITPSQNILAKLP